MNVGRCNQCCCFFTYVYIMHFISVLFLLVFHFVLRCKSISEEVEALLKCANELEPVCFLCSSFFDVFC